MTIITEVVSKEICTPYLHIGNYFADLNEGPFLGFEEQYRVYLERLYILLKRLHYNDKLSSPKLWYDIKLDYESYLHLKAQENQLRQAFEEQRIKVRNPRYNKKLERKTFEITSSIPFIYRVLSAQGFYDSNHKI
jgi:hypothetical protein